MVNSTNPDNSRCGKANTFKLFGAYFRLLSLTVFVAQALSGCGNTNTSTSEGDGGGDSNGSISDTTTGTSGGVTSGTGTETSSDYRVLAANDLGMHCADKDYQIFSILPPFNVVHGQVIKVGKSGNLPEILTDKDVDLRYRATSSSTDPAGAGSINTTSANKSGVYKSNFWEPAGGETRAGLSYGPLYPAGVFDSVEPLPQDTGIPAPDAAYLPALVASQQLMPGIGNPYSANVDQAFGRFDSSLHFFENFPFGKVIQDTNWFAADGIPMAPVDDAGRSNAYPLMKVSAMEKGTSNTLASLDVVLPTASEADCQNCHANPDDAGNGIASSFASVSFSVIKAAQAPGPENLLNAAKINILRLHDTKHGRTYTSSVDGSAAVCDPATDPNDPDCLANQTPVQCSQCHYSPALDLAQVGPVDETTQGVKGRQQTRHISMSRAMHDFHGKQKDLSGNPLFPVMPAPNSAQRTSGPNVNAFEQGVLNDSCYQCHPGKNTQCLRGAMYAGGVVCQDCHGGMAQVGNDFSAGQPTGQGLDLTKRVPWASEPKCQSCHTGDALNTNRPAGAIVAADGIRLIQAYLSSDADATPIVSANSRFAENQSLFRLSGSQNNSAKGHGGIMCEGCHGSTHAEWPALNPASNDNIAANQLQGHSGPIVECTVCHTESLDSTLNGPHGMHPVGNTNFANGGHEGIAEDDRNACRACHGQNGEGTVLSKVAADRTFRNRKHLSKGDKVTCSLCHRNQL